MGGSSFFFLLAPLLLCAAVGARAEVSYDAACSNIRDAISALADAEHAESQALLLYAHGSGFPPAERGLHQVVERTGALRKVLKKIRLDPVASEPSVENCLQQGFLALYQAEKLTAELEQLLLKDQGFPLAGHDQSPSADTRHANTE